MNQHTERTGRMLPGLLLMGLGLLVLFTNLGLPIVGNMLTAAIFGALAYLVHRHGVRTGSQGVRLMAIPLAGLAVVTLLPGRATGALFLALMGLAFALVWRTDQQRWWAIIPAGAFASMAAAAGLSGLPGNVTGFAFLAGLALTFYALTRLSVNSQAWAIYPAGALGVVSVLALMSGGGSWLFPLMLVAAGAFLLLRSGAANGGWLSGLWHRGGAAEPKADEAPVGGEIVPAPPTGITEVDDLGSTTNASPPAAANGDGTP